MAKLFFFNSKTLCAIICLLLLAISPATPARILDGATQPVPLPADASDPKAPPEADHAATASVPRSGQFPAAAIIPSTNVAPVVPTEPVGVDPIKAPTAADVAPVVPKEPVAPVVAPAADVAPVVPKEPVAPVVAPAADAAPVVPTEPVAPVISPVRDAPKADVPPVTTPANGGTSGETAPATTTLDHSTLSFFMHDILGGSRPSGRVVTGIVASSDANNLPFSKPNNQIFPIDGGVPLNTINGMVNNKNFPFLVGLDGSSSDALIQNNGNNVVSGGNNQAFVTAGQLPQGLTLQQLTFGSITVVDNEITEGHELGSAVLGKAQGFYVTSSSDGSTHTLVLTALFHGKDHEIEDTLSFFGIHRTATPISHIAIVGGTGKHEKAKGYATIETLPHVDQHTTDGVETITHFTVYLTP